MKKITCNIPMFLLIGLMVLPSGALAEPGFFEQRYRGWLWFEEKEGRSNSKLYSGTKGKEVPDPKLVRNRPKFYNFVENRTTNPLKQAVLI